MKKFFIYPLLIGTFFLGAVFSLTFHEQIISTCETFSICTTSKEVKSEISLDKFWRVYSLLQEKAVDFHKLEDKKHLEDSVIAGLVRSLDDPYSLYMSEESNKNFKEDLAGNFEGIGAELEMKDELVTIVSPLKDSPAMAAGLMPNDVILKVDGEDILGWSLTDVVKKIRGPKGETVVLTVARKTEYEPIEIKIIRDTIHVSSVKYELKENKIGYISVNQFGDQTIEEFFDSLNKAESDGVKALILDFRFNGGGYLDGAIFLASPFLNSGDIVTTIKSRDGEEAKKAIILGTKFRDIPMIALINGGSASASEIVAGALRDHKKAILVGEKSFGKGSVQELIPLTGDSSLRVTNAKWYTPNDQNIHKVGIEPDIKIARTFDQIIAKEDPQLDEAIKLIEEGNFDRFYDEKLSLTGASVLEFTNTGALIENK